MVPRPRGQCAHRRVPVRLVQEQGRELHEVPAVRNGRVEEEGRCEEKGRRRRGQEADAASSAAGPPGADLLHVPRAEQGFLPPGECQYGGPCRSVLVLAPGDHRRHAAEVQHRSHQALQSDDEEHMGVLERPQAPIQCLRRLRRRRLHHARLQGHLPPVRIRRRLPGAAPVGRDVPRSPPDQLAVQGRGGRLPRAHLVRPARAVPGEGLAERRDRPGQHGGRCEQVQDPRVH
mmetsp:Transcript_41047/g.118871  ORF Transcript_41047/g.118871 Transcript_41047/m.118871 type:complete len:232 (+) Transcript_41047:207-902(+)